MNRWMVGFFAAGAALLMTSATFALDPGARAPAFDGRALANAERIDLAQHRGSVVVVDFWASWCEPCAEAMPALERIYQRYRGQGLVVIGVSEDRTADNARGFLSRTRVSFPVMHDADHSVANRFRPPTMPSTYIIDRQGVVRHVHSGFRGGDAATLERQIRELL
ncbi:MAG: TlpA disulfide reductase family protein [Myxococcota bacterium]|nr:TlpA disulfide reductase family protein [Myxococcota bacterium]